MIYDNLFVVSLPEPFSKEEVYSYFKKMYEGDKIARDEIIKHNLRLVVSESKKYVSEYYEQEEIVAVGVIGLIKGVDTFDITKNYEFATYAIRCINNEILMFLRKNKKHTNNESIDKTLGTDKDGNELKIGNTLYDENTHFVLDYENKECYKIIREVIMDLNDRDREVIMKYFGFNDEPITQKEIAKLLGLSQSYISKLVKNVLKKISKQLEQKEIIEVRTPKQKKYQ